MTNHFERMNEKTENEKKEWDENINENIEMKGWKKRKWNDGRKWKNTMKEFIKRMENGMKYD